MPNVWDMLKTSLYIGATGYGGPAILAHIKTVIVKEKKWVTDRDFMESLSLSQLLPGAIGVTLMGHLGYKLKKTWGAILMPLGFSFPAFALIISLSWAYLKFGHLSFIKSLFMGLGALVISLLINALFNIGRSVFPTPTWRDWPGILIVSMAFVATYFLHLNIVYQIIIAVGMGLLLYTQTFKKTTPPEHQPEQSERVYTSPTSTREVLIPMVVLSLFLGAVIVSPAGSLFLSFMKVGALAFGGGFTSIPLMQQVAVTQHHWVDLMQFRDGIAMGQITPGPVLITAAFIGYTAQGLLGATAAILGIFFPSWLAVLILGAFHSKIKNHPATRAAMKGLLASFLGFILATTVRFGIESLINWQTWTIFVLSGLAIIYYKKDPLWSIAATVIVSPFILE